MLVVGLTGSIGMGKSTTAAMFARARRAGPRRRRGGAPPLSRRAPSPPVEAAFPGRDASTARSTARGSPSACSAIRAALARLEAIVHPLVRESEAAFLARCRARGAPHGRPRHPASLRDRADRSASTRSSSSRADAEVQRARVLARPGMTEAKLAAILARQMPDAEKRRRAHFVVDTGRGFDAAERAGRRDPARARRHARLTIPSERRPPRLQSGARTRLRSSGMREIVFDTETTGLDCLNGDRLIEIGCVELLNHIPTGRTLPRLRQSAPRGLAARPSLVHGLTDEFLRDQPGFEEVVDAFSDFVGDSVLVAHNAGFDRGFINMELGLCGRPQFEEHRFVDTLLLARRRHPNGPNSLDALCARYGIDNSARTKHGALLDAEILAEVYLELLGGRQATFRSARSPAARRRVAAIGVRRGAAAAAAAAPDRSRTNCAHAAFLADARRRPLWSRYRTRPASALSRA